MAHRHRGPIAIYAGLALDITDLASGRRIERVLRRYRFAHLLDLPYGEVVAVARLVEAHRAEHLRDRLDLEQLAFGDFSAGRFAWQLDKVRRPLAATSDSANGTDHITCRDENESAHPSRKLAD